MRVKILVLLLAAPSFASECPAKKCANWCKSELKENHCRVQPCCGCKMCDGIAMDAAARWDEGARKPRGNHAELD